MNSANAGRQYSLLRRGPRGQVYRRQVHQRLALKHHGGTHRAVAVVRVQAVGARGHVGDRVAVVVVQRLVALARHARARKERRHALRLQARGPGAPQADGVQVPAPVVAQQAVVVRNSQERRGGAVQHRVVGVLEGARRGCRAHRVVGRAAGVVEIHPVAGHGLVSHPPKRLVVGDRPADPIVESVAAPDLAADVGRNGRVLEQVAQPHGPLVYKLRRTDQPVDQAVALVRREVGQKRAHVGGRRNAAGQVQRDAPQELLVAGQRRRHNILRGHLAEDLGVDEAPLRDAAAGIARLGRAGRRFAEPRNAFVHRLPRARLRRQKRVRIGPERALGRANGLLFTNRQRRNCRQKNQPLNPSPKSGTHGAFDLPDYTNPR